MKRDSAEDDISKIRKAFEIGTLKNKVTKLSEELENLFVRHYHLKLEVMRYENGTGHINNSSKLGSDAAMGSDITKRIINNRSNFKSKKKEIK